MTETEMPLIDNQHFELAVTNISRRGDTDVFPLTFENHVLFDRKGEVLDLLQATSQSFKDRLQTDGPQNHASLAPLGYNGFRWATQIDPLWNAYFLGVVLSLAQEIEDVRIPVEDEVVFSHRFQASADGNLFDPTGWAKFQAKSLKLAENHPYVVSVDIADFYGRVYHHRIENELKHIDASGNRSGQIRDLLMDFSKHVSYGLPVGGPAARILSELVLNATDQLLRAQAPPFVFIRYADDYRFFVPDLEAAYRVIGFLSEKLQRNEGLSLQRSKTRIMTSSEFVSATRPHDPRPGSAAKFLSLHLYYDPYSATAEEDYDALKEQLQEFDVLGLLRAELFKGRVDAALTRKLVSALKHMQELPKHQAIKSLLDNIDTLTPVVPHVMRAIYENVDSLADAAQEEVHAAIRDFIHSGHHVARVEVNLAYMVRVLARRQSRETSDLLIQLFSRAHGYADTPAPNIQRDIILALARWEKTFWLHDIKPQFRGLHAWAARAFAVASFALGDEGRHWRSGTKSSLSDFDRIVLDWAADKSQQPGWEIPL
ncbi:RNA-directed DNA polymerase [Nocardioides albidus]|uniref:RNA-directed DNA polymerase n=1 Tax=Nocardioides albidus TaxID=1517589 RepID=A0A5C4VRQ9_9ACTN|nr:RNA-directed DNA polymerase [Nocardioides albidus]TNM38451.1 RNA-directed DNA polymerase [Nocardioides albidus]